MCELRWAYHDELQRGDKGIGQAAEIVVDQLESAAQLKHGARIDHVLTGGAPMNKVRRIFVILCNECRQLFDQRDGKIAGVGGAVAMRF